MVSTGIRDRRRTLRYRNLVLRQKSLPTRYRMTWGGEYDELVAVSWVP
jgi:hypothetical protein